MSLYIFSVWIHILLACVWVGGMIYTAAVVIPFAVKHGPDERQRILRGLARKFRIIGWTSVVLLIVTGYYNATQRYALESAAGLFDKTRVGFWLPRKLEFFVLMVLLVLFHDIMSIRAAKQSGGLRDAAPGNRLGSIAAAIATLLALVVLYCSVRIVRG
ncbi:MAG TPA: CopD family protein [Blastocatellia bacterium]